MNQMQMFRYRLSCGRGGERACGGKVWTQAGRGAVFWGCSSFQRGALWPGRWQGLVGAPGDWACTSKMESMAFLLWRHKKYEVIKVLPAHKTWISVSPCMACVRFKAKGLVLVLPGQWDLMEAGESNVSHSPQKRLYFSVCPCFDFLCSVVILEQKLVQLFN